MNDTNKTFELGSVLTKKGKTYTVAMTYTSEDGSLMVVVKGQKDGKDFGPFRHMRADSF